MGGLPDVSPYGGYTTRVPHCKPKAKRAVHTALKLGAAQHKRECKDALANRAAELGVLVATAKSNLDEQQTRGNHARDGAPAAPASSAVPTVDNSSVPRIRGKQRATAVHRVAATD